MLGAFVVSPSLGVCGELLKMCKERTVDIHGWARPIKPDNRRLDISLVPAVEFETPAEASDPGQCAEFTQLCENLRRNSSISFCQHRSRNCWKLPCHSYSSETCLRKEDALQMRWVLMELSRDELEMAKMGEVPDEGLDLCRFFCLEQVE